MVKETSKHFHRSLIYRQLHHTKQKKTKKRKGDNSKENGQMIQRGNLQKKIQIAKEYTKRCSFRLVIREMKI